MIFCRSLNGQIRLGGVCAIGDGNRHLAPKTAFLATALVTSLGCLAIFKYASFFLATVMWQGVDGAWDLLLSLSPEQKGRMLGHFPGFAGQKFSFLLRGDAPCPEGVYRRDSFNRYGDVVSDACGQNIMPGGSCRMQPRPRPENTGII